MADAHRPCHCRCFSAGARYAVSDAERIAVYKEFRAQYDAKKYAEAQPLAERLVELTEAQYGSEELPLTNPLTNLATVHYKLGHYAAAIENYQRTLRILQAKSTIADKQQIRPLHGLGVSFMGANDPESAVVALKRAADLSRNTDGLFNINQIEFIDALIDAYEASGRYPEAEKESPVRDARGGSRLRSQLDQAARSPRQARALVRGRAALHQRAQCLREGARHSRQERTRKRPAARPAAAWNRAFLPARSLLRQSKAPTRAPRSTRATRARRYSATAHNSVAARAR